jgi:hypothetical protein
VAAAGIVAIPLYFSRVLSSSSLLLLLLFLSLTHTRTTRCSKRRRDRNPLDGAGGAEVTALRPRVYGRDDARARVCVDIIELLIAPVISLAVFG